jgi:hypothetical protein
MSSSKHLAFFVEDYHPTYWYWEAVEMGRKLLLTGFAALWMPGTLMQIITSMFLGFFYSIFLSTCSPYRGHAIEGIGNEELAERTRLSNSASSNRFAQQGAAMTVLCLFGAMLVQIDAGFNSSGRVEPGYSFDTLVLFLVGTTVSVALFGIAALFRMVLSVNGEVASWHAMSSRSLARSLSRSLSRRKTKKGAPGDQEKEGGVALTASVGGRILV